MAIAFVAAGTVFSNTAAGTTFTLNKPAGVSAGDMMVAMVACWANGSQKTMSASGWTVRQTAYRDIGSDEIQVTMLTRVVDASDPASWTVTASGTVYLRVAAVTAYSGVQTLGASGQSTLGNGSSFSTATVNNDTANSWRVVCGAYFSGSASYNISSNEVSRRGSYATAEDSGAVQAAIWDSNAGIATGNTSRTVSRSANWSCAGATILLLEPSTGTPATGTLSSTLPKVTSGGDGTVVNNGTVTASLPAVTAAMQGLGQPPVATGTLTASLPALTTAALGGVPVSGPLAASITLTTEAVGETRAFGVRVIVVEHDDRTIEVESRAVAD